jgi:hypothetical protein
MEVIEHQERIKLRDLRVAEGPLEMHSRPLDCGPTFEYLGDAAYSHDFFLSKKFLEQE